MSKRWTRGLLIGLVLVLGVVGLRASHGESNRQALISVASPEGVLVTFQPGAVPAECAAVIRSLGLAPDPEWRSPNLARLVPPPGTLRSSDHLAGVLARLRRLPRLIRYAEPDYRLPVGMRGPGARGTARAIGKARAAGPGPRGGGGPGRTIPNDPIFPDQANLDNTGQSDGTPDADIDAPEGWNLITGDDDLRVAIISGSADLTHEDLTSNFLSDGLGNIVGEDFTDGAGGSHSPQGDSIEGTGVPGALGASGNNGRGIAGVCWLLQMIPIRAIEDDNSATISNLVLAFDFAISQNARIIVAPFSLPDGATSMSLQDAVQRARQAGILVIAAAGNDGANTDMAPAFPGSYNQVLDNVLSVAGTDATDALVADPALPSNFGATTVDLAAPGADIPVTAVGNDYVAVTGTEFAAAQVAGVAGLILSANRDLTYLQVKDLLLRGADRIAGLAGVVREGRRLNAGGSLRLTPMFEILGTITEEGKPRAGITVRAGGATAATNNDGTYALGPLPIGTYTVRPELAGRTFDPDSRTVELLGDDALNVDFVLQPAGLFQALQVRENPATAVSTIPVTLLLNGPVTGAPVEVTLAASNTDIARVTTPRFRLPRGATQVVFQVALSQVERDTEVTLAATRTGFTERISLRLGVKRRKVFRLLQFSRQPVFAFDSVTATLDFGFPQPGGTQVNIQISHPDAIRLPANPIRVGGTRATLPLHPQQVDRDTDVTVTFAVPGETISAVLTVRRRPVFQSLQFNRQPVNPFESVIATLRVQTSVPAGTQVQLESSHPAIARLPTQTLRIGGAGTYSFPIQILPPTTDIEVTITARIPNETVAATLSVRRRDILQAIQFDRQPANPFEFVNAALVLALPVPGGATVNLTSSHPTIAQLVQSQIRVGGAGRYGFAVRTLPPAADTDVTITATIGQERISGILTVKFRPIFQALTFDRHPVTAGEGVNAFLDIAYAPAGGPSATVTSSHPTVAAPAVNQFRLGGAGRHSFLIRTQQPMGDTNVTITVAVGAERISSTLTVKRAARLGSLVVSPDPVVGGGGVQVLLTTLSSGPVQGPLRFTTSNAAVAPLPRNEIPITSIGAGTLQVFVIQTRAVTTPTRVTLTASLENEQVSTTLTVLPPP